MKWNNLGKGVAPSPTPRCSSYWKGSFRVTFAYGRQLYFIYIYIYIYSNEKLDGINSVNLADFCFDPASVCSLSTLVTSPRALSH